MNFCRPLLSSHVADMCLRLSPSKCIHPAVRNGLQNVLQYQSPKQVSQQHRLYNCYLLGMDVKFASVQCSKQVISSGVRRRYQLDRVVLDCTPVSTRHLNRRTSSMPSCSSCSLQTQSHSKLSSSLLSCTQSRCLQHSLHRHNSSNSNSNEFDELTFNKFAEETLENLCDLFEELGDSEDCPRDYDVTYGDGVLTVKFGQDYGTYVINKQTPNKQIWLSSPTSGPKRYDYLNGRWIYRHDGVALHNLLTQEISDILDTRIDFTKTELKEQ